MSRKLIVQHDLISISNILTYIFVHYWNLLAASKTNLSIFRDVQMFMNAFYEFYCIYCRLIPYV